MATYSPHKDKRKLIFHFSPRSYGVFFSAKCMTDVSRKLRRIQFHQEGFIQSVSRSTELNIDKIHKHTILSRSVMEALTYYTSRIKETPHKKNKIKMCVK